MKKIQLTNAHKEKLFQIPLFRDLPLNIKESLLDKLDFVIYAADKKEIVVTQGTPCNKLYVLLEGKLRTDIIDGLGNEVMIEYIIAPRTFATFSIQTIRCQLLLLLWKTAWYSWQPKIPLLKSSVRTRRYCTIFFASPEIAIYVPYHV